MKTKLYPKYYENKIHTINGYAVYSDNSIYVTIA